MANRQAPLFYSLLDKKEEIGLGIFLWLSLFIEENCNLTDVEKYERLRLVGERGIEVLSDNAMPIRLVLFIEKMLYFLGYFTFLDVCVT